MGSEAGVGGRGVSELRVPENRVLGAPEGSGRGGGRRVDVRELVVEGLAHRLDALAMERGGRVVPFEESQRRARDLLRWLEDPLKGDLRVEAW